MALTTSNTTLHNSHETVLKNVTRFRDFFILFYQYDFVVGLLQGFMPMNQEVIPRGWGLLAGQNKVPAVQGFYPSFAYGKISIPAIPRPSGEVIANDWCISRLIHGIARQMGASN